MHGASEGRGACEGSGASEGTRTPSRLMIEKHKEKPKKLKNPKKQILRENSRLTLRICFFWFFWFFWFFLMFLGVFSSLTAGARLFNDKEELLTEVGLACI